MPGTRWEELYVRTVQEVTPQKIREGIAATRQAITNQLRDLEESDHAERLKIDNVLKALETLEREVRNWDQKSTVPEPPE